MTLPIVPPEGGVWDVVVVGAGPAGSASAATLVALGWSVLLLDRAAFPRPKPCGECINPGGVAALSRLGLLDAVLARSPSELAGWAIRTERGRQARGRFAPHATPGLALPREVLDQALVEEAVARGVVFRDRVQVVDLDPGTDGSPATLHARATSGPEAPLTLSARMVVAADGLRSTLARRLSTVKRPPRLRKLSLTARVRGEGPPRHEGMLFLGPEGTVGVAPVHATLPLWNVTVVVDPEEEGARVKVDPGAFVEASLAALPLSWTSPPTIEGGPWASGPFDWPSARSGCGRVLFVGDAAGYYDPLTGQGIFRALRSAELASGRVDQVLRGGQSVAQAVEEHGASLRRAFGPGRTVQRLVEAVISSELPRDVALRHLARGNRLDALIRVTGDAAPVRTLLHPMLWLPRPGRPGTPHSERT
jgi:menaquinone-9 beta-reductase